MARPQQPTLDALREQFQAHGQDHVLRFWDRLDPADRGALLDQACRIAPTLDVLIPAQRAAVASLAADTPREVAPVDAIALPAHGGDPDRAAEAGARGEAILAQGRLAAFVVAGGQGTRLGFPGPKGCFPVGPVTERSLFEIQAQKIRGLARRIGRPVPWYVMTSPATDAPTREFFQRHRNFGLPDGDVMLFLQDCVASFDFEGRLMLEEPFRIAESPNGHGGALTALCSSGAIEDMERRGIDTIFYYQVDNPLVKIGDPVYLGFHDEAGAEMSCKVVRKVDPMEKVGVVARIDGRVGIVEYTELKDEQRFAEQPGGGLRFWAGNIAVHLLATDFVKRVAGDAERLLPYHASAKKIPTLDAEGRRIQPEEPNGYKLERFVFDALGAAQRVCVVETSAPEEFSPIKNAEGKDSAATARRDLVRLYRSWLEAAKVEPVGAQQAIEIDHSRIDSPEEAVACAFGSLEEARDTVQIGAGTKP